MLVFLNQNINVVWSSIFSCNDLEMKIDMNIWVCFKLFICSHCLLLDFKIFEIFEINSCSSHLLELIICHFVAHLAIIATSYWEDDAYATTFECDYNSCSLEKFLKSIFIFFDLIWKSVFIFQEHENNQNNRIDSDHDSKAVNNHINRIKSFRLHDLSKHISNCSYVDEFYSIQSKSCS